MNLEYYNVFYQVALSESITRAAQKLNMSQPSVSRYITLLEEKSNKQLFIRSKSGVKLTPEGHILFDYVSKGIEYIHKAESEFNIWRGESNAILNLAVSQLTIKTILPPILEIFQNKNPDIKIKLTTGSSSQAIAKLQSGLSDIAIIPSPIDSNPLLKIEKIKSSKNILIGGRKYDFLKEKELTLADLKSFPFISLAQGTAGRSYIDKIFAEHNLAISPEIEVPTSDLIPDLVKNNLGLGIVAEIFASKELVSKEVIKLKMKEELPNREFLLCTNRFSYVSESSAKFINILMKYLDK